MCSVAVGGRQRFVSAATRSTSLCLPGKSHRSVALTSARTRFAALRRRSPTIGFRTAAAANDFATVATSSPPGISRRSAPARRLASAVSAGARPRAVAGESRSSLPTTPRKPRSSCDARTVMLEAVVGAVGSTAPTMSGPTIMRETPALTTALNGVRVFVLQPFAPTAVSFAAGSCSSTGNPGKCFAIAATPEVWTP